MALPQITLTCDCGNRGHAAYGERWACSECGKTYDTGRIPRAEYDALSAAVRRYKLLTLGPPVLLAAVLVPLAVLKGAQFGFLLFVLVLAYGLLVLPRLRGRATAGVLERTSRWKLDSE